MRNRIPGLEHYRIELAIQKYLEGDASTWKAAEIAGVSLRIMIYIKILDI